MYRGGAERVPAGHGEAAARPTVRQLEYVVAVADHLSFRKAATACGVTQPALSTQIQALERVLAIQVFERDRRAVLVTPAGEEVVAQARRWRRRRRPASRRSSASSPVPQRPTSTRPSTARPWRRRR